MNSFPFTLTELLAAANVAMASIMVILAFSLLGYTFHLQLPVAGRAHVRDFADVRHGDLFQRRGPNRVLDVASTEAWLRFQWLGIAMVPAGYHPLPPAVRAPPTTACRCGAGSRRGLLLLSVVSAASALFGNQLVGDVIYSPPISYLDAGPYFGLFVAFFTLTAALGLRNVWKARQRCIHRASRRRMTYILLGQWAGHGRLPVSDHPQPLPHGRPQQRGVLAVAAGEHGRGRCWCS
ncbi:MAG: hypothetical protein R3A10_20990 [Caldilineaceae bacterium]